jgi:hypothetical protein
MDVDPATTEFSDLSTAVRWRPHPCDDDIEERTPVHLGCRYSHRPISAAPQHCEEGFRGVQLPRVRLPQLQACSKQAFEHCWSCPMPPQQWPLDWLSSTDVH